MSLVSFSTCRRLVARVALTYGGQAPVFLLFLHMSTGCWHWLSARLLSDAVCDLFPTLTTNRLDVFCSGHGGMDSRICQEPGMVKLYRNFHQGDL